MPVRFRQLDEPVSHSHRSSVRLVVYPLNGLLGCSAHGTVRLVSPLDVLKCRDVACTPYPPRPTQCTSVARLGRTALCRPGSSCSLSQRAVKLARRSGDSGRPFAPAKHAPMTWRDSRKPVFELKLLAPDCGSAAAVASPRCTTAPRFTKAQDPPSRCALWRVRVTGRAEHDRSHEKKRTDRSPHAYW